jgi:hypothetical protein
MALRYSRSIPRSAPPAVMSEVEDHVRAHLSAVADEGDDPGTHAAAVRISHQDDGPDDVLVLGELDAEPNAPYLRPGYDPEEEQP